MDATGTLLQVLGDGVGRDGAAQVALLTAQLDAAFIFANGPTVRLARPTQAVRNIWRVGRHPVVDGRSVDLKAALREHHFDVAPALRGASARMAWATRFAAKYQPRTSP